eukprot:2248630-Rhodomonas_salina.2
MDKGSDADSVCLFCFIAASGSKAVVGQVACGQDCACRSLCAVPMTAQPFTQTHAARMGGASGSVNGEFGRLLNFLSAILPTEELVLRFATLLPDLRQCGHRTDHV